MQNNIPYLKEPSSGAEFFFKTPLMRFPKWEMSSAWLNQLHEDTHAFDLFALYPTPVINSTILNFLFLKGILESANKHSELTKTGLIQRIKEYVEQQDKIQDTLYSSTKDDGLEEIKLDVLFEATALENQYISYLQTLSWKQKINFDDDHSYSTSTILEAQQYMKQLFNSNVQYRKAFAWLESFHKKLPDNQKSRFLYSDKLSLSLNFFNTPPNLDGLFKGEETVSEVFPIIPRYKKILGSHIANSSSLLKELEEITDNKLDIYENLISAAKQHCKEWANWARNLKGYLKSRLDLEDREDWRDPVRYLIDLPLDNIARANKLEKILIDSFEYSDELYHKTPKEKFIRIYRPQLMINKANKVVPDKIEKLFNKKRNVDRLITKIPRLLVSEEHPKAVLDIKDGEEDNYKSSDWIKFFIFNHLAKKPERFLESKTNFLKCPFEEEFRGENDIYEACRNQRDFDEEIQCRIDLHSSIKELLHKKNKICHFTIVYWIALIDPLMQIADRQA